MCCEGCNPAIAFSWVGGILVNLSLIFLVSWGTAIFWPIGLGLAMAQPKKVIAIDGDGSVLMNLGTLPTIANNQVPNFILLIIDNGSYGSTGDQTTYAGMRTSLADVARACGCDHVVECAAEDTAAAVEAALAAEQTTVIVSKCESGNIKVPVIELDPVMIKERFMASVAE